MRKLIIFFLFSISINNFRAQTVTWADDIACILYSHCTSCHRNTNSLAAFPLMTYSDAWGQRTAIKIFTSNKYMPPYLPDTKNTTYAHEKNLSQQEINLIVAWANGGA